MENVQKPSFNTSWRYKQNVNKSSTAKLLNLEQALENDFQKLNNYNHCSDS